jgi:hypothetical protein
MVDLQNPTLKRCLMKEYVKSATPQPCRLKKGDLVRLAQIISDQANLADRYTKRHFRVSVDLRNVHVTAESIEDLLEQQDLPDKFTTLKIYMSESSLDLNLDRVIYLRFSDSGISLEVSGPDETWVLGKYAQIKDFLREKRPWFWPFQRMFLFISAWVVVLSLGGVVHFARVNELVYSISSGILLATSHLATVFYWKGTFLPYTQIALRPERSFFTKQNVTLILGILSLIVSIIGGLIIPLAK